MENREEKREALKILVEFNGRLMNNMKILIRELREGKRKDTDILLNDIVNAINWEISIMSSTLDLLNEDIERINKDNFNEKIKELGNALWKKEDEKIANAVEKIIVEFLVLEEAAKTVI